MQGDKRVNKYMLPLEKAIIRHVKDEYAQTDIYNRCYEAVSQAIRDQDMERSIGESDA